jgi:hypothetical protein
MHAGEVLYRAWALGTPITYDAQGLHIPKALPAELQAAALAHEDELIAILHERDAERLLDRLTQGERMVACTCGGELRSRGVPRDLALRLGCWMVLSRIGRYRYPHERAPLPADDDALLYRALRAGSARRARARARAHAA